MDLENLSTKDLLIELQKRGGSIGQVAKAQLLVLQKSLDYNGSENPGNTRDEYFPFGILSYAQMIWTKALRFKNLGQGRAANFESLDDTALDLINYCSFFLDWRSRQ